MDPAVPPARSKAPGPVPRVTLRHPLARDRDEVVALLNRSRDHLIPWWSTARGYDGEGFDPCATFERLLESANIPVCERFLVCHKDTRTVIGCVSVSNIARGAFESCTLGYWAGVDGVGQGLMTEAVALMVRHVFRDIRLHRVEANIMPRNVPSTLLVQRLGFREEGLARRYIRINYQWEDHVRWGMTLEDFERLAAAGSFPFTLAALSHRQGG